MSYLFDGVFDRRVVRPPAQPSECDRSQVNTDARRLKAQVGAGAWFETLQIPLFADVLVVTGGRAEEGDGLEVRKM